MPIKYGPQTTLDLQTTEFPAPPKQRLKPMKGMVHLRLDHQLQTRSRLLKRVGSVDEDKKTASLAQAHVIAIGSDVEGIKPDDLVLVEQHAHSGVDKFDQYKDGTCLMIREAVVAVLERR